jgi:protein-L-isoaspartate(D-aspartate) O-methyltransferase
MSGTERARGRMVARQLRRRGISDERVLAAMERVPREEFVPAQHRALAFSDMQIPIGDGQRMWEPKLEARVLQELDVHRTDRVLEVGTGSGYFAALLAHRAAHVYSVEINERLAAFARHNLERHGADNVTLEIGDAARGWDRHAPYHVIVLTGSTPVLPRTFYEQLEIGGRLFAVVGELPVMSARVVTCTAPGAFHSVDLFETVVAPLVNAEHPPRFRF